MNEIGGWDASSILGISGFNTETEPKTELGTVANLESEFVPQQLIQPLSNNQIQFDNCELAADPESVKGAVDSAQLLITKLFEHINSEYKVSFATLSRGVGGVNIQYVVCDVNEATEVVTQIVVADRTAFNLGCYVRVTPLNAFFSGTGRGTEKDSAGSQVLWADLDTYKTQFSKDEVTRKLILGETAVPPPTLIIDSGNGLQLYWCLSTFITDLEQLKTRGRGIAAALKLFGADSVYNPAQLLRIPGTCNRKNPIQPKTVKILSYVRGNVYDIEQFPNTTTLETTYVEEVELPHNFLEDLKHYAPEVYSRIVSEASAKTAGATVLPSGEVDRSANDMWVAVKLFSYNVIGTTRITSGVLRALFMQPDLFIHVKVAEKGIEYAVRTILQAETYVSKVRRKDPQRFFSGRSFVPALLGEEILYEEQLMSAGSQMWIYNNGVYRNNAAEHLRQMIVNKLGVKWQRAHAVNTIEWVRATTQKNLATDVLPYCNVLNGMLHITPDHVELLQHSPTYCSLSQMPVEYLPACDLTEELAFVDEFVAEILHRSEAVDQFFQFIGTVLLPDYRFKKVLLLIGPPDCGKSTLLSLFVNMLGEENVCSRTFQDLAGGNRFARASLIGKLANVYADLPTLEARDVGPFKALTGNDIVDAEFKGVDAVSFRNYAKLIFSTNAFPRIKFADQAFFNRWLVIPCDTRFVPDEETQRRLQLYEPEMRVFLMDRRKVDKFGLAKVKAAFLLRAIEGLQRLLKIGQFNETESTRLVQGEFMAHADPVSGFLCACTEPDDRGRILKSDMYTAFLSWCNYYSVEKISMRHFNKRLTDLRTTFGFFETANSTVTVDGVTRSGNVVIGRTLKNYIKTATGTVVRLNSVVEITGIDTNAANECAHATSHYESEITL